MSDDLIKRLRSAKPDIQGNDNYCEEAADELQALTARAETAEKALAEVAVERDGLNVAVEMIDLAWDQEKERADAAEARIATIERETLERAAVVADIWYRTGEDGTPHDAIRAMIEEKTDE